MDRTKDVDFTLDTKALKDDGTFEGYGSVFGNVDSYGEKVMPGAFKTSLEKNSASVIMLWNHNRDEPIGKWEGLKEDSKGLFGKGVLNLDTQRGREVYSNLKMGIIKGLSIGYRNIKWENDADDENIILLTELDLKEISPVTFAANASATITAIKGYEGLQEVAQHCRDGAEPLPIRRFEDALRDVGFSQRAAKAIASRGYSSLALQRESEAETEAVEFLSLLKKSA